MFVHAVLAIAVFLSARADFRARCVGYSRFLSAGADFRVCTRCVGYSRCYLLGQIFVFLHAVWAIAGFYLLFQINMFCIHSVDCSRFSIKSGLWSACILVKKKILFALGVV